MADMIPQGTQDYAVDNGHERGDVNIRTTLISGVVVVSATLVAMLAMAGMFRYMLNREKAKDATTPALYSRSTRPSGPPLLPSIYRDELPWEAYQNERREMEANAARIGIIDRRTGYYQVPRAAQQAGSAAAAQKQYYKTKYQWDSVTARWTNDSSGGRITEKYTPDGYRETPSNEGQIPGVTMTQPKPPSRRHIQQTFAPGERSPLDEGAVAPTGQPTKADHAGGGSHGEAH
jgi:hypothetical protein